MSRKFLYIIDPLEKLNVKTDTTLSILKAAQQRAISNYICEIKDISLFEGSLSFTASKVLNIDNELKTLPKLKGPNKFAADEFDAVLMRKDPPVDNNFIAALMMLRCYNKRKTFLFNDPDGLLVANEKLFGLQIAKEYFPKTLVSSNKDELTDFLKAQGKVVLKPLFGAGGSGVMIFDQDDNNFMSALELLSNNFANPVILQSFIKNARLGDKRILLLGEHILGAILRLPSENDHRANLHVGGNFKKVSVTKREKEIINSLIPHFKRLSLHFVGLDVIDGYLTEINVTSPTCLREIESGLLDKPKNYLSDQVLDYIEKNIRSLEK